MNSFPTTLCPHTCSNRTEFGYCRSTACINPDYNGSGTYVCSNTTEFIYPNMLGLKPPLRIDIIKDCTVPMQDEEPKKVDTEIEECAHWYNDDWRPSQDHCSFGFEWCPHSPECKAYISIEEHYKLKLKEEAEDRERLEYARQIPLSILKELSFWGRRGGKHEV